MLKDFSYGVQEKSDSLSGNPLPLLFLLKSATK
jgi:hypothetical protein